MNDITKARYYLKSRQSSMQHFTSFGLMLSTAEGKYREVKLRQKGNKEGSDLTTQEIEATLDYAVLRYLKRFNQLPGNVADAFVDGVTTGEKQKLAIGWLTAV